MRHLSSALLLCVASAALAGAPCVHAQTTKDPLVSGVRVLHDQVKDYLVKAANQVPEILYGYKATPEVRSFAQLFGHVSDTNYAICAAALGEKPPVEGIEQSKMTKGELTKALTESFAYCDKVLAATTDTTAATILDFFGSPMAKLAALSYNAGHNYEHYGNVVTYMRLNKMVPPSSQPSK